VDRVQSRAAEDAGVQVPPAGAKRDVEIHEAARREVEHRDARAQHRAVVDDADVGAAVVGRDEVDDRVAAGFLLAVAAEP
jgi:hypothetical protein